MKVVEVDEKISVWKRVRIYLDDRIDISNQEQIEDAIVNGDFDDKEVVYTYHETEDSEEFDFDNLEVL